MENTEHKTNGMYQPKPLDTSDVKLSEELQQLGEQLARNVHDNWAVDRQKEGWTYGPERNDTLKQHPCLVDYNDLPESEKEYDRNTAMETLKMIQKLGWKVENWNNNHINTNDFEETLTKECKRKSRTWHISLLMSISLSVYVGIIVVFYYNSFMKTPMDFVANLSVIVAITLMFYLWLKFLGRIHTEKQQVKKNLMSKIQDAYNNLLEVYVRKIKEEIVSNKGEQKKKELQQELELQKINLELQKINLELKNVNQEINK